MVRKICAALGHFYKLAGVTDSPRHSILVQIVSKRIVLDRTSAPITHKGSFDVALATLYIQEHWPDNAVLTEEDLRTKVVVLLLVLRPARVDDLMNIMYEKVKIDEEGAYIASLSFKNDTLRKGDEQWIARSSSPELCFVAALEELLRRHREKYAKPAGLWLDVRKNQCIKKNSLATVVQRFLIAAEIRDGGKVVTPHSFKGSVISHLHRSGLSQDDTDVLGKFAVQSPRKRESGGSVKHRHYDRKKGRFDASLTDVALGLVERYSPPAPVTIEAVRRRSGRRR